MWRKKSGGTYLCSSSSCRARNAFSSMSACWFSMLWFFALSIVSSLNTKAKEKERGEKEGTHINYFQQNMYWTTNKCDDKISPSDHSPYGWVHCQEPFALMPHTRKLKTAVPDEITSRKLDFQPTRTAKRWRWHLKSRKDTRLMATKIIMDMQFTACQGCNRNHF